MEVATSEGTREDLFVARERNTLNQEICFEFFPSLLFFLASESQFKNSGYGGEVRKKILKMC